MGQNHGNQTGRGYYEPQDIREQYWGPHENQRQNPGSGYGPDNQFGFYHDPNLQGTDHLQNIRHPSQNPGLLPDPVRYGYNGPHTMQYPNRNMPTGR